MIECCHEQPDIKVQYISSCLEIRHQSPFTRSGTLKLPDIIGHGRGFAVQTEEQLGGSLSAAEKIDSKDMCILDVRLANHDGSSALQRLTETLGKKVL